MSSEARAGEPGEAQFPTFYHPLVTLRRIDAFANANGFEVLYQRRYESLRFAERRVRHALLAALVDGAAELLNLALLRRIDVVRERRLE